MKYYQTQNIFYACGTPITVAQNEKGETHVYSTQTGEQLSTSDLKFGRVFGGGKDETVLKTDVVMKSGFLYLLSGGCEGGCVETQVNVTLEGGMIGGALYGAGIGDKVGDVFVKICGGAIKYGFFGGGNCNECQNITLDFANITCTNVKTGSKNPLAEVKGKTSLKMTDGHVLVMTVGGGVCNEQAEVEISGGIIEKQIVKETQGKLHISLYENIYRHDSNGGFFPMLPKDAEITHLPPIEVETFEDLTGDDTTFFDAEGEENKLTFRFFELRKPDCPRSLTPFPTPFVGDSCYITFPDGTNMLVDTGMPYSWDEVYSGLVRLGVKNIDRFVITHAHSDHMGNGELILEKFHVKEIWIPDIDAIPISEAERLTLERYYKMLENAKNDGVKIIAVGDTDVFNVGETEITVLNPIRTEGKVKDLNENSIAFRIFYKENSALMCGDISDPSEKRLAEVYGDWLKCDLLKVAHHGIVYQSYYKFIDCCMPRFAVVPSLRDNGVFIKTTKYSLENVNHFDTNNLYLTGRWGKIKVVMDGKKNGAVLYTQYS